MSFLSRAWTMRGIIVLLAGLLLAGCGGGNGNGSIIMTPSRPVITGLSQQFAVVGDTIDILGANFGDGQSVSSARLNGVDFTVSSWSDTAIKVTVSAGMTTGMVVVTVNGQSSLNSETSQLTVTALPVDEFLIIELNPAYGASGETFEIIGQNFGEERGAGNVVFVDEELVQIVADIQEVDVEGVPTPQWADQSVTAVVPELEAGAYNVYISTGTEQSNEIQFVVLAEAGAPHILNVEPPNAPAGETLTITGVNFGDEQGGSLLSLGALEMAADTWSEDTITAKVPIGALSGKITVTVEDIPAQWPAGDGMFTVDNPPEITEVNPAEVETGGPLEIRGMYFGAEMGESGAVSVGGTVQNVSAWQMVDGEPTLQAITIDSLLEFTDEPKTLFDDSENPLLDIWGNEIRFYEVIVTGDSGLTGAPGHVSLPPELQIVKTVDPSSGQRAGANEGEDGTVFTFSIEVIGGTGEYTFELTPDATKPTEFAPDLDTETPGIQYVYPADAAAPDVETYETLIQVTDTAGGDPIPVPGPTVTVVQYGFPLVTTLAVHDFNRTGAPAPNDLCYRPADGSYHDFSFLSGKPLFTSSLTTLESGGSPLAAYPRNLADFQSGGKQPRGHAYRYYKPDADFTNDGAIIAIHGLNFGTEPGQVFLDADGGNHQITEFAPWAEGAGGWSPTEIRFYVPGVLAKLCGTVRIARADTVTADAPLPLMCAPYVSAVVPVADVELGSGTVTLMGLDFTPPEIEGVSGPGIYGIWEVTATYTDPWSTEETTGPGLLITPVQPVNEATTSVEFRLGDLDIDHDGTVLVEVANGAGDEAAVVDAKLAAGTYRFFLWSGVLADGTPGAIATSGIFSETYTITTIPSTENLPPVAVLTADPVTGVSPLNVTLDATGSYDPNGNIKLYQWDLNGNGIYSEPGMETNMLNDPGPIDLPFEETTTVGLRVYDDGDPQLMDEATQTISVGTAGTNNLTLSIQINLNGYSTGATTETRCWLFRKDTQPTLPFIPGGDIPLVTYQMAVDDGNFVTQVFSEDDYQAPLIDGTYWLHLTRVVTDWDSGDEESMWIGPFVMPPDQVVLATGDQNAEIPDPGGD